MATSLTTILKLNTDLPPGVNEYPTLKGKQRFDALVTFNWFIAGYISIHKLIVPLILTLGQGSSSRLHELGGWYFYHILIGILLTHRTQPRAYAVVYLAWFAIGLLPWMVLASIWNGHAWKISWITVSGLLTYGTSFVFNFFLLYRMRMPTTAFLYKLPIRIVPKWEYAVPYFLVGFVLGFSLFTGGVHV